jgi:DNA-binding HxlR family transcriptional regulator
MTDEIEVYDEGYPSRRLLELIGDKWTPIIVYGLPQKFCNTTPEENAP